MGVITPGSRENTQLSFPDFLAQNAIQKDSNSGLSDTKALVLLTRCYHSMSHILTIEN